MTLQCRRVIFTPAVVVASHHGPTVLQSFFYFLPPPTRALQASRIPLSTIRRIATQSRTMARDSRGMLARVGKPGVPSTRAHGFPCKRQPNSVTDGLWEDTASGPHQLNEHHRAKRSCCLTAAEESRTLIPTLHQLDSRRLMGAYRLGGLFSASTSSHSGKAIFNGVKSRCDPSELQNDCETTRASETARRTRCQNEQQAFISTFSAPWSDARTRGPALDERRRAWQRDGPATLPYTRPIVHQTTLAYFLRPVERQSLDRNRCISVLIIAL